MASEEKKIQGLKLATIFFVMTTIGFAVGTFMFSKSMQEVEKKLENEERKSKDFDAQKTAALADTSELKKILDADDTEPVKAILDRADEQMAVAAATYRKHQEDGVGLEDDEVMEVYPKALETQLDKYKKLIAMLAAEKDDKVNLSGEFQQKSEKDQARIAELNATAEKLRADLVKVQKQAAQEQQQHEAEQAKHTADLARAREEVTKITNQFKEEVRVAVEAKNATVAQNDALLEEIASYKVNNLEVPDGKIIGASVEPGMVYLNRGSADGLRRQTTFSVFDENVMLTSPDDAVSKGSVEVIRILDKHLSLARVTHSESSNPILKGDLIFSPIFRPGRPERFAVTGDIDLDGDGTDDLSQLMSIVRIHGGVLDAYPSEKSGRLEGKMTSSTRFLVLGDPPARGGQATSRARETFVKMKADADKLGVRVMPLNQFLDYMGYQSQEQQVDLAHQKKDRLESTEKKKGDKPFRKRPARGNDGAF